MPRHTHPPEKEFKFSQKWLQVLVNERREVINRRLAESHGLKQVCWLSPLKEDGHYAEYSDNEFIDKLGVKLKTRLESFWPVGDENTRKGPQWDALAKTGQGEIILVEAKSYITESLNPCGAGGCSLNKIQASLEETKRFLGVCSDVDWADTKYYQYTNRLAHLYFLKECNEFDSYLLYIYFMNDTKKDSPRTQLEWERAIDCMKACLGIPEQHRLSNYILNEFIDVRELINQK